MDLGDQDSSADEADSTTSAGDESQFSDLDADDSDQGEHDSTADEDNNTDVESPVSLSPRRGDDNESGIVLLISLKNFMCHRNLEVELCRRINFISGHNGSGKSAILAALQVCLGAAARLTHRGTSLADLVCHEADGDAEVKVQLLNTRDGYRYDIYGDSITVKRVIKRKSTTAAERQVISNSRGAVHQAKKAAGATLELISHGGRVVSRTRKELDAVLDALNISVDNPCVVLDQENSKKFIKGSAQDKYTFFLKATDLQRIQDTQKAVNDDMQNYKAKVADAQKQLPLLLGRVEQAKGVQRQFDGLANLRKDRGRLQLQLLWSDHHALAADALRVETKATNAQAGQQRCLESLQDTEADIARLELERARLDSCLAEEEEQIAQAETAWKAAHKEFCTAQHVLSKVEADASVLATMLAQAQQDHADIQSKLEEEHKRQQGAAGSAEEHNMKQRINELATLLAATEQQIHDVTRDRKEHQEALDAKLEAGRQANARVHELETKMSQETKWLSDLSKPDNSGLKQFGAGLAQLVNAMTTTYAGHFQQAPTGPLGLHIKIKPEFHHYAGAVQEHLSAVLQGFIVTSHADKTTLMDIMRKAPLHGKLPPIYTVGRTSQRHRTPVFDGVLQLSEMLEVERADVFNVLVDHSGIERTLFAPSKDDAEGLLQGAIGYQQLAHSAKEVYYPQAVGANGAGRGRWERLTVRNGNTAVKMHISLNARPVLAVDNEQQKRVMQQQLRETDAQYNEAKRQNGAAYEECVAMSQRVNAADDRLKSLQQQRVTIRQEHSGLCRRLEAIRATQGPATGIAELEADKDELEQTITEYETEKTVLAERLTAAAAPLLSLETAARTAKNELDALNDNFGGGYDDLDSELMNQRHSVALLRGQMEQHNSAVETAEQEAKTARDRAAVRLEQVSDATRKMVPAWDGRPWAVHENRKRIAARIAAKDAGIARGEVACNAAGITYEQAAAEVAATHEAYASTEALIRRARRNVKKLRKRFKTRQKRWLQYRNFIEKTTKKHFDTVLRSNHSSGDVTFNHITKRISLLVQPNNLDETTASDNVRNMSGGERSFATLSLLLSLGQSHDSPIRAMDEFDVFMDSQARTVAMKLLVQHARANKNRTRQFIFITPQDLCGIQAAEDLHIIMMREPRS